MTAAEVTAGKALARYRRLRDAAEALLEATHPWRWDIRRCFCHYCQEAGPDPLDITHASDCPYQTLRDLLDGDES